MPCEDVFFFVFFTCHLIGEAHAVAGDEGVGLEGDQHGPPVAVEVRDAGVRRAELVRLPIVSL